MCPACLTLIQEWDRDASSLCYFSTLVWTGYWTEPWTSHCESSVGTIKVTTWGNWGIWEFQIASSGSPLMTCLVHGVLYSFDTCLWLCRCLCRTKCLILNSLRSSFVFMATGHECWAVTWRGGLIDTFSNKCHHKITRHCLNHLVSKNRLLRETK